MTVSRTQKSDVTALLRAAGAGDGSALDRLFPLVYEELRRRARGQLRKGWPEAPQTTVLVHEAYLKLAASSAPDLESRAHFFAVAARAMRQILLDHARKHRADKRGGEDWNRTALSDRIPAFMPRAEEVLALDQALFRLETIDPRLSRVVELRFFVGMAEEEIAEILGVSTKTIRRDWAKARAWLYRALTPAALRKPAPKPQTDES